MLRDITLGQFYPGRSVLHRMDPRVKILLVLCTIVFIFVASTFSSLGLIVALVFISMCLSGVPLRMYGKSLKAILFVVLFTSVLNLFYGSGDPVLQWGFMRITVDGIRRAVFVAVRISTLIVCSAILTFTTSPTQLTDALEDVLGPLKKIHVPVHEISMMMSIALRFIPILMEETDKIMKAQMARGADFESKNLMKKIQSLVPLLVPLFISAFRRANDLAMAMEARCYRGGDGRTKMKPLVYCRRDYAAYALLAAYFAVCVVLCIVKI